MEGLMKAYFLTFFVVVGLAMPAQATLWSFPAILLDGLQETPPVATPATGLASATIDDVTGAMTLSGSFMNLIGTSNNFHLHGPAAVGVGPAGVLQGFPFDAGVTSGTFGGNAILSATNVGHVLAGNTYLNVHSTFRPGGEIRGQLLNPIRIPEPATMLLLVGGLAPIAFVRRPR
jgi:hypothetical protein